MATAIAMALSNFCSRTRSMMLLAMRAGSALACGFASALRIKQQG
jgi:hypothetical protein